MKKTSLTYRFLCLLGFKYPVEDYGDISLWKVIKQFFTNPAKMVKFFGEQKKDEQDMLEGITFCDFYDSYTLKVD